MLATQKISFNFFNPPLAIFTILTCLSLLLCAEISLAKQVRVGIFQNEPIIFKNAEGVAEGLYADVLNAIAQEEGWQLKYVHDSWNGCLNRLHNGDIDLMTSIAYTLERDAYAGYSQEVMWTLWAAVYLQLNSTIDNLADLQGKNIAILRGDINGQNFLRLIEQLNMQCEITELSSHGDILQGLEANQYDAGVISSVFGAWHMDQYRVERSSIIFSPVSARFAVPEGTNRELINAIDKHLVRWKLESKSAYQRSLNKWVQVEPEKIQRWYLFIL